MTDRVTGEEDDRWRSTQEATRQLTAARGAVPPPDVVAPQRSEQPDRDGPGGTRVEPVGNRGRDSAVSGDRRATAAERSGVRTEAVPEPADVAAPPSPSAARAPTPAATSPVSEVFEAVPAAPESDPPGATSAVAASPPRDATVPAAPERAREVPASPAPIPSAPDADPPVVTPEVPASPPSSPQIAAMQVLVRAPDALLRVGGGPYMVPVSVGGASRLSTISITLLFDPDILLARTVLEGTFMRQGGAMVTFEQQVPWCTTPLRAESLP